MNPKIKNIIKWTPRVLTTLYLIFISLFALDSFEENKPFFQLILGFIIHLIPSLILIGILWISWKKEKLSGIIFIVLAVIFTFFFHTYKSLESLLIITLPLLIIGCLYIYSSSLKK